MDKSIYIVLLCSVLAVQFFGSHQALMFTCGAALGIVLLDLCYTLFFSE